MYQPEAYTRQNEEEIFEFIQDHPFAVLMTSGPEGRDQLATHIPVLAEGEPGEFRLFSHIANHNEQLKHLENGQEGLFVFHGAHAYVSSSWYHKTDISTWDYSAVHVNFRIRRQSRAELTESLKKLVFRFEKDVKNPVYFEDLPDELVEDHLSRITGFWAEPLRIQAIGKLHQDFSEEDVESVIGHLRERGCPMDGILAEDIKKERKNEDD